MARWLLLMTVLALTVHQAAGVVMRGLRPAAIHTKHVRTMTDGGINHVTFVGGGKSWKSATGVHHISGIVHLYLRCLCGSVGDDGVLQDLQFRGFVFVEPLDVQRNENKFPILLQGDGNRFKPTLKVELADGTAIPFTWRWQPSFIPTNTPHSIHITIPGKYGVDTDFKLHFEDWPQFQIFSLVDCIHSYTPPVPQPAPSAAIISNLLYNADMSFVGKIIVTSLNYHNVLGFSKWEMYATRAQVHQLLQNPDLRALVNRGQVSFVTVNALPHFHNIRYAYQCMFYTHALLSHWGANTYLMLTDYDEYLVMPTPGYTVQTLMSDINKPVLFLTTFTIYSAALLATKNETAEWTSRPGTALKLYDKRHRPPNKAPKCIVDPAVVDQAFMHAAHSWDVRGGTGVPLEKAYVVEVYNLFSHRMDGIPADATPDTTWHYTVNIAVTRAANASAHARNVAAAMSETGGRGLPGGRRGGRGWQGRPGGQLPLL